MVFVIIGVFLSSSIQMRSVSYVSWFFQSLLVFSIWTGVMLVLNLVFYQAESKKMTAFISRKVFHK